VSAAVSFIIAALIGYCGVRLWLPADDSGSRWIPLFHATLGIGLGTGVTGCLYWLLLVAGIGALAVVLGVELILLAALAALVLRQRATATRSAEAVASSSFPVWLPGVGLAVILGLFVTTFASVSDLNPQGGWDAFSIWNLRARFLLHNETWKFAVTAFPVGAHMEYPLLLSSVVARGWVYAGSPSPVIPITTALVFAVALAMLLVSALALLRGASIGLLAGVILLASPSFLNQAPSQFADVPLAFFFLAALALIALGGESSRPARYLSLAGVSAGFAAWTKNEGSLLLIALVLALFANARRSAGWRSSIRQSGTFLLGALPGLLLVLWFKVAIAPPDPLAGQITVNLGQKLFNGGRWFQVAGGFLKQAWELYIFPNPPIVFLALTCGLLRLRPREERAPGPLLAVFIALAGYFAIFLVTKDDLEWLFATALDRLYMHVWPALLLAVFLLLRRPEDFAVTLALPRSKKR
jgi:Dolichyl-phosphate-mannose-protein mannosyltransferase